MSRSKSHWQPESFSDPSWSSYDGPYLEVWNKWWNQKGKGDQLIAEKTIALESLAGADLINTQGKFYIREHHVRLYEHLCERATHTRCGGVVLSGQPGTGKTYFLFFLLLKKLAKGEPVIFSPNRRRVLYFASGGVQSNKDITPSDLDPLIPKSSLDRTWALINSDEGDRLSPPTALVKAPMFSVQATSPRTSRYKDWVKQRNADVSFVPRWTREELSQVVKLANGLPKLSDSERESLIDKAISRWGWAPRDIITYLCGEEDKLETALANALFSLTSSRLLDRIHDREGDSHDKLSHVIVSTYKSSTTNKVVLDLKSQYIAYCAQQQLDFLHRDEALRFITYCRAHRESSALAGWAFENYVIDTLSNTSNKDDLSATIPATPVSSSSWSARISSTLPTFGHRPSTSLGLTRTLFDKTLKRVTLDDTKLYLPSQCNFPLLDAFYLVLDHENRHAEVVVLQITISLTHKGSAKGYPFLERLKGHLQTMDAKRLTPVDKRQKQPTWSVSFAYHLVVPSSEVEGDRTVTWSFPGKFPESISGPVYIQVVSSQVPTLVAEEDASFFEEDHE
ncbi:hypothetical protein BDN71DRAFT_1510348 [Pleurotus eryngii]|uniref:Uncharacterized protein n=1 Tax=Pleurotus eryngii TaxID=5323 RepID=A0A9P5ZP81_PLEER|nr:hypothetical protein BDN71DRAFT_1510348 [Pleurotus eryngii]